MGKFAVQPKIIYALQGEEDKNMAFGINAKYYEKPDLLEAGVYNATVLMIEDVIVASKSAMRFTFSIDDFPGFKPNVYTLFDVDPLDSAQHQEWTSKRISRFCDAFDLKISDKGIDFSGMHGKKCKIEVARRENGYMDIVAVMKYGGKNDTNKETHTF